MGVGARDGTLAVLSGHVGRLPREASEVNRDDGAGGRWEHGTAALYARAVPKVNVAEGAFGCDQGSRADL